MTPKDSPAPRLLLRVEPYERNVALYTSRAGFASAVPSPLGDLHPNCVGRTYLPGDDRAGDPITVWLPPRPRADVLAHEALHVAYRILDDAGVRVDEDNHEALAYLLAYLVREFGRTCRPVRP